MRCCYFLPSLLTVGFFLGLVFSFVSLIASYLFITEMGIFLLLAFGSVAKKTDIISALIVSVAIIVTHLSYGVGFIRGLLTRKLIR